MAKHKPDLYVNRFTGDIAHVFKRQAKALSEDWSKVDFVKNEDGKAVMRMHLEGATVDVLETEPVEVAPDGDKQTK